MNELLKNCLEVLREVEWEGFTGPVAENACPSCREEPQTHAPGCRLAGLIRMLQEKVNGVPAAVESKLANPPHGSIPEPYCRATDLELLQRLWWESDLAKQELRKAGYGVTGMGLLDTVREALADHPSVVEDKE